MRSNNMCVPPPRLLLLLLALVSALLLAVGVGPASAQAASRNGSTSGGGGGGAFLGSELPLQPLVTTPSELLAAPPSSSSANATAVTLTGRQAITAVFSRPVIALGSDWGGPDPSSPAAGLVPFRLTCGVPGRLRWVTTSIARFDPSVEWPPDLDCAFEWSLGLRSWDGLPLALPAGAPAKVPLKTRPLEVTLSGVASEAAANATDGLWSATVGMPDDGLPEVPPGANVTLEASYPLDLSRLASLLTLVPLPDPSGRRQAVSSKVSVLPCEPRLSAPLPVVFLKGGAAAAEAATTPAGALSRNSTCAVVRLDPPLPQGAAAALRLPKGSKYAALAGPLSRDVDVKLFGLRRFRLPFRSDWSQPATATEAVYVGAE